MILQFVDTVIKHGLHYFGPQIGNSRSVTRSIARSSVLTTNSLSTLPTLKICTVYYNLGSSLPSITFTHSDFSQDTAEKKNKGCFFLNLNGISSIHRRKQASHSGTSIDASESQGKNSYNKLQNYIMYQ